MPRSPIRVAIVDDEPAVRVALSRLLTAMSFETRSYGSAREFIDSIETEVPACLVVDVHMPEITGLELQRYLRRIKQKIPTIVITAFDDAEIGVKCSEYGAAAFLTKPLHGPELIDAVRAATADR